MAVSWEAANLWQDQGQLPISSGEKVASYEIVAGPAGSHLPLHNIGICDSSQWYVVRSIDSTSGDDLKQLIEVPVHSPRSLPRSIKSQFAPNPRVLEIAQKECLPLIKIRLQAHLGASIMHNDADAVTTGVESQYKAKLVGWVGINNGVIADDERQVPHQLICRGQYDPERDEDTVFSRYHHRVGTGIMDVYWELSNMATQVTNTQNMIRLGLL